MMLIDRSKKSALGLLTLIAASACVHKSAPVENGKAETASAEVAGERVPANTVVRSGYRVGDEMCGQGGLAFPRLPIDTRAGYCVGLVASKEAGLVFPRTIEQIPGREDFVVVDMGGWPDEGVKNGKVLLLERTGSTYRVRVLLDKLYQPHGLRFGPDGKAYVGTLTEIFRFDPLNPRPANTVEYIVRGLQGWSYKHEDGSFVKKNSHPMKHFVFDREGNLYVNIGAPTDACLSSTTGEKEKQACKTSEGRAPSAAVWKFKPQVPGKPFRALAAGEPNPQFEVFSRGLRNSMALAAHPNFPQSGYALLQGENSKDLKDPAQPHEELNALEPGMHYGWPYCHNENTPGEEFKDFLKAAGPYQNLCDNSAKYRAPYSVLPPHSAPLGMTYYWGDRFQELKNSIVVGLHGYAASGNRIVFARVDDKGFPVKQTAPTMYSMNCSGKRYSADENKKQMAGVQFEDIITGWYPVSGMRPLGAPVGITVASDGSLWVVEDKNQTILRIDVDPNKDQRPMAACDMRTEDEIKELVGFVDQNPANKARLRNMRENLVEKHCLSCHGGFNIPHELADPVRRDELFLRFLLSQDGWIKIGDVDESDLHVRTHGLGPMNPMPGNARELLRTDATYQKAIADLDQFLATIVPGELAETIPGSLTIRNAKNDGCGSYPAASKVVVMQRQTGIKDMVRIYRPSKQRMNGKCDPKQPMYLNINYLKFTTRTPQSVPPSAALFEAKPFTAKKAFTFGIEGPAVGPDQTIYAVNFARQGTIGAVDSKGQGRVLVELPKGSIGNSIRIGPDRQMYIADYKGHKIYRYDFTKRELKVHAHNPDMNQPNDITISKAGVVYASDPNWKKKRGQIWRVSADGETKRVGPEKMGTTNGIDLSVDEKELFVGESEENRIYAYQITEQGLGDRRLVTQFKDHSIDGLRVDVEGNLWVTRIGKGTIVKITSKGELLREITLNGKDPTNLAFGGTDGKTVYVTQRDGGYIETFRSDSAGREWTILQ